MALGEWGNLPPPPHFFFKHMSLLYMLGGSRGVGQPAPTAPLFFNLGTGRWGYVAKWAHLPHLPHLQCQIFESHNTAPAVQGSVYKQNTPPVVHLGLLCVRVASARLVRGVPTPPYPSVHSGWEVS